MIDTHCHIDFEEYGKDRDEVISRAKDKLDAVIVSGIGYESNKGILDLCKNIKTLFIRLLAIILFLHKIAVKKN